LPKMVDRVHVGFRLGEEVLMAIVIATLAARVCTVVATYLQRKCSYFGACWKEVAVQ